MPRHTRGSPDQVARSPASDSPHTPQSRGTRRSRSIISGGRPTELTSLSCLPSGVSRRTVPASAPATRTMVERYLVTSSSSVASVVRLEAICDSTSRAGTL